MSRDQIYGALILIASVIGIIAYAWFLYIAPLITLQITAFIAVTLVLGIMAWIGYTLATTPPPKPIEEIEKELKEGPEVSSMEEKKGEEE